MLDRDIIVEQRHTDAVNYEKAIIELFEAADEDRDGELKLEEFRAVMQRADLGLSDGDIIALVEQLDIDGNHVITWREFLPLALTLVDSMEAQTAAAKARLDKIAWAEHEAAALEALYAPDFENAIEGAVAHLEFFEGSGGGMSRKEDVRAVLSELRAPEDLRHGPPNEIAGEVGNNSADEDSIAAESNAAGITSGLIEANPLLRLDEITKLCNLLDRGMDGSRKEIMDTVLLKATALDVRFQTVRKKKKRSGEKERLRRGKRRGRMEMHTYMYSISALIVSLFQWNLIVCNLSAPRFSVLSPHPSGKKRLVRDDQQRTVRAFARSRHQTRCRGRGHRRQPRRPRLVCVDAPEVADTFGKQSCGAARAAASAEHFEACQTHAVARPKSKCGRSRRLDGGSSPQRPCEIRGHQRVYPTGSGHH